MAKQKAISANPERNNGGVIVQGGNIDNVNVTAQVTLRNNAVGGGVAINTSKESAGNVNTRPFSGGNFNKLVEDEYLLKSYSTKISGVASNLVKNTGGTGAHDAIHYRETDRRIDIDSWNYVTGVATSGGNAGDSVSWGEDHAARPTDAVPGEFIIAEGKANPTQKDYPAKG